MSLTNLQIKGLRRVIKSELLKFTDEQTATFVTCELISRKDNIKQQSLTHQGYVYNLRKLSGNEYTVSISEAHNPALTQWRSQGKHLLHRASKKRSEYQELLLSLHEQSKQIRSIELRLISGRLRAFLIQEISKLSFEQIELMERFGMSEMPSDNMEAIIREHQMNEIRSNKRMLQTV